MKQFHNYKSAPDLVKHPSNLMKQRWSSSFFMIRIGQLRISIKVIWLVNTTQLNLDGNSRERPAQRGLWSIRDRKKLVTTKLATTESQIATSGDFHLTVNVP